MRAAVHEFAALTTRCSTAPAACARRVAGAPPCGPGGAAPSATSLASSLASSSSSLTFLYGNVLPPAAALPSSQRPRRCIAVRQPLARARRNCAGAQQSGCGGAPLPRFVLDFLDS